ncbi:dynein light chain roadblock-type 2 isoform X1 [Pteropus medius]|uniref:dynein light chain roadblock-type 2 isoform X1 n=1 Tax=Pteropus vampyrus TaxID=132908 RepID=UPI00196ADD30|nr:dynein light chain roadblock-type 2 isoform X1 [Pteropus giganteus]
MDERMTWSSAYAPLRSSAPPPRRLGETQVRSRGHCLHLRLRRPGGARPVQGGKAVPAAVRPLRTQARAPTLPGGHFLPRLLATARRVVDIPGRGAAGLSPESRSPRDGIPIRTTLDNSTTVQYAGLLHQLTVKAKSTVRDIDPQNDLTFLRIRSKKHEIMVAPDKEYLLIVIQNPCE